MVVAAGNGRERVDGRLRPGKEVRRTLIVGEAIRDRFKLSKTKRVVCRFCFNTWKIRRGCHKVWAVLACGPWRSTLFSQPQLRPHQP